MEKVFWASLSAVSFVLNIFHCDMYLVTKCTQKRMYGYILWLLFLSIFAETRLCRKVCKVLWNSVELKLLHAVRNWLVTVITPIFVSFSLHICQVILKLLSWHISWPFVCGKFLSCKTGTVHEWLNINCLWQHTATVLHMACILWNNLSNRKWNVRSLLDMMPSFLWIIILQQEQIQCTESEVEK
jgi:hypothetical protein